MFPIGFKLKKIRKNGNTGEPYPGEAGNQAVAQPVVDEPNEYDVHPPQPTQHEAVIPAQPTVQQIAVAYYPVPEKFSFKPDEWLRWIRRFERIRKATGLD